jgi:hypothetical protein
MNKENIHMPVIVIIRNISCYFLMNLSIFCPRGGIRQCGDFKGWFFLPQSVNLTMIYYMYVFIKQKSITIKIIKLHPAHSGLLAVKEGVEMTVI